MAFVVVVLASLLVGAAAYLATLRVSRERPVAVGFDAESTSQAEAHADPAVEQGYTYLRVPTTGPTWRDRAQGVVELLALLFVASAALAFGIYQLGHLINLTIERFLAQ
jgi:hypothetical protein